MNYAFTVRPQHIHRYREYANIYKEEEEERLQKWKSFLEQQAASTRAHHCKEDNIRHVVPEVSEQSSDSEVTAKKTEPVELASGEGDDSSEKRSVSDTEESVPTKEVPTIQHAKSLEVKTWAEISPSLNCIEHIYDECTCI